MSGPGGFAAGSRAISGTAVKTPDGNVYGHATAGARGIAAGPNGIVAGRTVLSGHGYVGADGTHYFSPTYFHAQGLACGRWCAGHGIFGTGWFTRHPWVWYPAGWSAVAWSDAAWNWATWPTLGDWLAYDVDPGTYNYGDNIIYQDGNVYYGMQPVETEQTYYNQAVNLASNVGGNNPAQDAQWLPLGVFGLMPIGDKTPQMIFQLAIDKQGVVRGNCFVPETSSTVSVQGLGQR